MPESKGGLWRQHFHPSVVLRWDVLGWIVAIIPSVAAILLGFNQYRGANVCFMLTSAFLFWKIIYVASLSSDVFWQRALFVFILCGVIGVGIVETVRAVNRWAAKHSTEEIPPIASDEGNKAPSTSPSLVFVFGAPLGDNDSASWVMILKHYGPGSAHNCDIGFYDDDRKNIEHEWLVKHPNTPYPQPGLAGESQKRIHVVEASPEGSAGNFTWQPLDPNRQHYTVSIT